MRKAGGSAARQETWLGELLARNGQAAYLQRFGAPATIEAFRRQVPTCTYEALAPWIARLRDGERDLLFAGRPVAWERTGGSTGGTKLIPYSGPGLRDFRRNIVPWLSRTLRDHDITGSVYLATSPATRAREYIGAVPVGLPDGAYLGEELGMQLARRSAVPPTVGQLTDVAQWREQTIAHLRAARDLELISVWSPTFLLRLLEEIPDPARCWPRLKVVSCWTAASAARYLEPLRQLLPQVHIQPKGLLSTEAVITVPGDEDRPVLAPHGFVEFAHGNALLLEKQLEPGSEYEVVVTTAGGLYRFRTGDRVRFEGRNGVGEAILEFVGRDTLHCDLVGEKLTEAFVARCLAPLQGFAMLIPDVARPGYVLVCDRPPAGGAAAMIDERLQANAQYAYARKLGQLAPLRLLIQPRALPLFESAMHNRGVRLGDIKPAALRSEDRWLPLFQENGS